MAEYVCSKCGNPFSADGEEGDIRVICPYCSEELTLDIGDDILPEGFQLSGFEIVRLLASGSAGRVYLANQVAMNRLVAIKVLKQKLADSQDEAERFINEARNTAKFQHPHIVTTLESGVCNGHCYIAMQYVNGDTLESMLDSGKIFSESNALNIVMQIAGALRQIWNKHQMFHKDIKPGNIMLDSESGAMLLDMGIAQQAGEAAVINGEIEGSPYYMSPEQSQGTLLTWSTDLYSLGVTLYQMVTGKVPYYDKSIDKILEMHNTAPYPEPNVYVPGSMVSAELSTLMRRMMGKTPLERFASWEDFLREAGIILEHRIAAEKQLFLEKTATLAAEEISPVAVPVISVVPKSRKLIGRWIYALVFLVVLLFSVTLFWAWMNQRSAEKTFSVCELDLYGSNLQNYRKALDQAVAAGKKFGVKKELRKKINDAYIKMEKMEKSHQIEKQRLASVLTKAEKLRKQGETMIKTGNQSVKRSNTDQNHYSKAREALAQALAVLAPVKTTDLHSLAMLKEKRAQIKALDTEANNLIRERDIKQKKLVEEQKKKQLEDEKKKQEALRKTQQEEVLKKKLAAEQKQKVESIQKYQTRIAEYQTSVRRSFLSSLADGTVEKFEKSLKKRPSWLNPGQEYQNVNKELDSWLSQMRELAERVAEIHEAVYDSRKEYADFPMKSPESGKMMKIGRIKKDYILLYQAEMMSENIPFHAFPPEALMALGRHAAEKKKIKFSPFSFSFGFKNWENAKQNAGNGFEKSEISFMINMFFSDAASNALTALRAGSGKEAEQLLALYGKMPEFAPFREKLLAEIKNSAGEVKPKSPEESKQNVTKGKK